MKIWLNDRLLDEKDARVSVMDHGFLYGDGIYETVHAYHYKIFHWPDHYKRLIQSARRIELKCPWSARWLEQRMEKLLTANQEPHGSVRITVARGPGPLGLDPTVCSTPTLALILHPSRNVQAVWAEGISIGITKIKRNPPEALDPAIKSNNSLNTILAKIEAMKMKVFEGVLTNLKGKLTEGTTSNIFFIKGGVINTPALECGLLAGITRESVIRLARKKGFKVQEGHFTPHHAVHADEVFLSSTTLEIAPVVRIRIAGQPGFHRIGDGRPGSITRQIHAGLRESIHHELNR